MRNFEVGSVMGIPIRVNISLVLFLPALAWIIAVGGQLELYTGLIDSLSPGTLAVEDLTVGNTEWVIGFAGALGLFVSVLLHELGHSWMARRYDVTISSITLWIFGGMARMNEIPEEWDREFWIALAGPAVSVLLGVGGIAALQVVPESLPAVVFLVGFLGVVNVTLTVFNLLPAFPMDGGRVLRALLARRRSYVSATRTAATVGKGMAVLMGLVGLLGNPLLILIALFVYMAATQESRATVVRELLRGLVVRELMTADVTAVDPDESVAAFVDRVMLEHRSAYPVVEAGELVGVVSIEEVRAVPPEERSTTTLRGIMTEDPATVDVDEDAFRALQAFGEAGGGPMLVTRGDELAGVLTGEDFVRALEVIQGLAPSEAEEVPGGGYA